MREPSFFIEEKRRRRERRVFSRCKRAWGGESCFLHRVLCCARRETRPTPTHKALCPRLPLPEAPKAAPPPPPPPMAAPTVSLLASPLSIDKGKCADLTWSSTSASTVSIDPADRKRP